jgi:hypothetical protein
MTGKESRQLQGRAFWLGGAVGLSIGLAGLLVGTGPAHGTAEWTGQTVTPVSSQELPNLPATA